MKTGAIIESLNKFSGARFYVIAKNRNFWVAINLVQRIFFNFTSSFLLVYTNQF